MIEKKLAPLVVIGCPTYSEKFNGRQKIGGGISIEWAGMWAGIQTPLGSVVSRHNVMDKVIDIARNDIVDHALEIGAEWIFFIADDVFVPSDAIMKMIDKQKEIVTGVYWTKEYPTNPYIWRGLEGSYKDWKMGEFFEIDFAGCDCLLVHNSVFRKIGYPYFSRDWTWFRDKSGVATPPSAMNTEDFYFYAKAKDAGYKVWCDSSILCKHQDRRTGKFYGLLPDMPQFTGKKEIDSGDNLVAVIGDIKQHINGTHVRIGNDERDNPDIRSDIKSIAVDDSSYDVVAVTNQLEKQRASDVATCLNEWIRILKLNGKLIITTHNLDYAFKMILNGDNDEKWWNMIYGHESNKNSTGFTEAVLFAALSSSSCLKDVKVESNGQLLSISAIKCKNHEPLVLSEALNGNYVEQTLSE